MHRHADEIRATDLPGGGLRIDLPDRKSAPESCGGVLLGLFLVVCAAVVSVRAAASPDQPYGLLLAAVGAAGALTGLFVVRRGLFGLVGFRRTIEVGKDRLRVVERLGVLARSRKRALPCVRGFVIRQEKQSPYEVKSTAPVFLLDAECAGRTLRLADRCPRPVLTRLAERLAEACRAALAESGREAPPCPSARRRRSCSRAARPTLK